MKAFSHKPKRTALPTQSPSKGAKDDASTEKTVRFTRHRLVLLVAHFLLTYPRWSWSLFLFCASQSIPMESIQRGLQQPIKNIQTALQQESERYENCTQVFFSETVVTRRNVTVQTETARMHTLHAQNQQTLELFQESARHCQHVAETTRLVLQNYGKMHVGVNPSTIFPLVDNYTLCPAENRKALMDWLWSASPSQHQIVQLFDDFVQYSTQSTMHVGNYSIRRLSYDYDYFVGRKMNTSWWNETLKVPKIAMPELPSIDIDLLSALDGTVLNVLNDAMVRVVLLEQRLLSFMTSLADFDVHYRDLYFRLVAASDFVRDFLPKGIPSPSCLNLRGVPGADLLLPEVFEIPHFYMDLPDLDIVRSRYAEIVLRYLNELHEDFRNEISTSIRQVMLDLREAIQKQFTLEDYNPPRFENMPDSSESIQDEIVEVQEFGEQTRTSLKDVLSFGFKSDSSMEMPTSVATIGLGNPPVLTETTSFMSYLQPQIPLLFLPHLLVATIALFITHKWLVEITIQCFRGWGLCREFLRSSTTDLPKIIFDWHDTERPFAEMMQNIQSTVLWHFVTPWMAIAFVFFPIAVIGATLWLPHVAESCIDSSEGTLLARYMIAPVLINQLTMNANTYTIQEQLRCNRETERMCLEKFMLFDEVQRRDNQILAEVNAEHNHSVNTLRQMRSCMDLDRLDGLFRQACCAFNGSDTLCDKGDWFDSCPYMNTSWSAQSFLPFDSHLSDDSCVDETTPFTLKPARFNCTDLNDICSSSTCAGIDTPSLKSMIISEECKIEVYFMKGCLLILVALYHAIMLNLCCTLMFKGLKHLWWRQIAPEGLQLVTRVNERGSLLRAASSRERATRVAPAIRRFEFMGKVQVWFGLAVFLIWCLSFSLSKTLFAKFR